jgi:hypothetical protein
VIDGVTHGSNEVAVAFARAGVYDCEFRATDPEGALATLSVPVTVLNMAPEVSIDVSPVNLETGGSIGYSVLVVDTVSDMGDLFIEWDFGDGGASYNANGSYVYHTSGTYLVRVTVEDDDGDTDSASVTVTVTDPAQGPDGPGDGDGPSTHDGMEDTYLLIGGIIVALVVLVLLVALYLWRMDMSGEDLEGTDREPSDREGTDLEGTDQQEGDQEETVREEGPSH